MTAADLEDDAAAIGPGDRSRPRLRLDWRRDGPAVASFALVAFWVTSGLWLHPDHALRENLGDDGLSEWFLAHGVRVWHGLEGPFHSGQMGAPHGVNLMANTAVLGLSLPLAPLTMLLGTRVTFALLTFLALMLTPTAWYFLLSRLLRHRWAGWVGAVVAGLSPGILTNAEAHLNLMSQFLVPVLIWRALKLCEPGRAVRNGLWLAAVALWQLFIGSEVLLLTAVAVVLYMAVVAAIDPRWRRHWRQVVSGGAVAGGVALAVAAYPLWFQFRGADSYTRLPSSWGDLSASPLSYFFFARQSLWGSAAEARPWVPNPTEEDALLGLLLVVAAGVVVVRLRHASTAVALGVVGVVALLCSLGPRLTGSWGAQAAVPLPWALAAHVPILASMVPVRWALVVSAVCGVLVALGVRDLNVVPAPGRRAAALGLAVAAIVPNLPKPLPTTPVPSAPAFFSSAAIRPFLVGGGTLLFAPPTTAFAPTGMYWSAESGNGFPVVQGYFLAPQPDGVAAITPPFRPLSRWLWLEFRGQPSPPPRLGQAVADLRYWHTTAIVLDPMRTAAAGLTAQQNALILARMRDDLSTLLGRPPEYVDGVELWDVRQLTATGR